MALGAMLVMLVARLNLQMMAVLRLTMRKQTLNVSPHYATNGSFSLAGSSMKQLRGVGPRRYHARILSWLPAGMRSIVKHTPGCGSVNLVRVEEPGGHRVVCVNCCFDLARGRQG